MEEGRWRRERGGGERKMRGGDEREDEKSKRKRKSEEGSRIFATRIKVTSTRSLISINEQNRWQQR